MSRSQAAAALRVAGQEGTFLVRESESKPGEYSLSVCHDSSLRHYHIRHEGNEYFISDRHRFSDVCSLVDYHKLNGGGLVTRLKKCVKEVNEPVTLGMGADHLEIDPDAIELGKELGSGQFGVVRMGIFRATGEKVAVKMMKRGTMSEDEFISEAAIMK